jgi:hypothetical protein
LPPNIAPGPLAKATPSEVAAGYAVPSGAPLPECEEEECEEEYVEFYEVCEEMAPFTGAAGRKVAESAVATIVAAMVAAVFVF